jgi:hypothetical protein
MDNNRSIYSKYLDIYVGSLLQNLYFQTVLQVKEMRYG